MVCICGLWLEKNKEVARAGERAARDECDDLRRDLSPQGSRGTMRSSWADLRSSSRKLEAEIVRLFLLLPHTLALSIILAGSAAPTPPRGAHGQPTPTAKQAHARPLHLLAPPAGCSSFCCALCPASPPAAAAAAAVLRGGE